MFPELLYKFGQQDHMERLAYSGDVYLYPASKFNNGSLPKGAHDPSELIIEQQLPPEARFYVIDKATGKKSYLETVNISPLKTLAVSDYYTFCMTTVFNPSMFHEFEADTCVVINDPKKFLLSLGKAIETTFPGWACWFDYVAYYSKKKFYSYDFSFSEIMFAKESDYAPQNEFRFVCIPPEPVEKLEPITVNVGQLLFETSLCFKGSFSPSPLERP